jgi:streptogramin lyase
MTVRTWTSAAVALAATLLLGIALVPRDPLHAQSGAAIALGGEVRAAKEGALEGVLVSARRAGSTKTVTVVTNAKGVYAFPRERLEPGRYDLAIRAVGFVLAAPAAADVTAGAPARMNLSLRPSNVLELAHQLTDPEWLASYPLDDKTKFSVFRDCSRCHSLLRASMSTYNADQLAWVMKRMVYSAGSSPMTFQLPQGPQSGTWGRAEWGEPSETHRTQAAAVAAINLSRGMWPYELKTLPRPRGKETQVIYTTWDLPVTSRPHDTRIGKDGLVYFNHFNDNAIGRLDPRTGETKEWRWPYRGDKTTFAPTGARTLMGPDAKGRFYIGNQAQGGLVIFDPSTETFRFETPPGGGEMMDVSASHVDGYGWRVGGGAAHRINIETFESTAVKGPRPLVAYDIAADTKNNLYGSARNGEYVWKVDAKTLQATYFDIPAAPRGVGGLTGGMRRGITDAQDRLWWGGYDGNFVGMLDPRRPAGEQMKLYPMPPWFFPYDAHHDDVRYTWTAGIYADRVARLNVETGNWDFYLLPFEANIRDIDLHPARDGGLSGLWFGHTHQAKITLVEPLAP